jgi:hypothetical protein
VIRTQVQIPDALYRRVKEIAAEKELSIAEMVRRGLEYMVEVYPTTVTSKMRWHPPVIGYDMKARVTDAAAIRDLIRDDEESRILARDQDSE